MDFRELAAKRRSVRSYKKHSPIPRKHLEICLQTARLSPSACNSQPWKFIVIDDPSLLERVAKEVISGAHKMNLFAADASAFIAVVVENLKPAAWAGGKIMGTDFRLTDAGIAAAHLVLQAEDLGINTCILGWFNEKKLKRILGVPGSRRIPLLIAMGYEEKKNIREKDRKPFNETAGFNSYS
ncbi:MAG TPA: nitroreductase family protein [Candidatus Omnitrophota bacterium]|nr:nitroreductase family protein [Candidatus Omnitrophota bacterium]